MCRSQLENPGRAGGHEGVSHRNSEGQRKNVTSGLMRDAGDHPESKWNNSGKGDARLLTAMEMRIRRSLIN